MRSDENAIWTNFPQDMTLGEMFAKIVRFPDLLQSVLLLLLSAAGENSSRRKRRKAIITSEIMNPICKISHL
jgi:hypothetical protein